MIMDTKIGVFIILFARDFELWEFFGGLYGLIIGYGNL